MSESSSRRRSSFFIKYEASSEEAISSGFRWLLLQTSEENRKSLFLAVPSLSSLQGKILPVIGEPAVRALTNNGRMNFNRAFLRLVTVSNPTALQNAESSTVLALYPNCPLLRILDDCPMMSSILVIPAHFSEIKSWIAKWNARELGTL